MDTGLRIKLYGRQITEEEYREGCDNLSGFFKILRECNREKYEKEGIWV
jgi:hypothetical protein